jgi:hypothetical protein
MPASDDPDAIKTKFSPFEDWLKEQAPWSHFYYAAMDWLMTYQLIEDQPPESFISPFTVKGPIVALVLEQSVKALALHYEPALDVRKSFGHQTTKIIEELREEVPPFQSIASDAKLMKIIREYEKWIHTKYGGYYMAQDREEYELLVATAYLVFNEIHARVEEDRRIHREKVAAEAASSEDPSS